jgi:endonuclease G, mitochondrial
MPFFSICNIDGAKIIRVKRDTGKATGEPEASETWAIDPRVPEEAQLSDDFYRRLRSSLRTGGDFFARGHMTRREDPNWGQADTAERANSDTFHHTNACPQIQQAFNGSQQAWQGIENYILDTTNNSNLRVTVITGPVFDENNPIYDDEEFGSIALPRQFWKIVARVENGKPIVFAILADQSEAMDLLLAGRRESREALWDWPARLSKDYISTVAEIAALTKLDFGNLVDHDIFAESAREFRESLNMLGAIAEFETEIRAERQLDGIHKAKKSGVHFGRKKCLSAEQILELRIRREQGVLIKTLMKDFSLSKASVYRYLEQSISS